MSVPAREIEEYQLGYHPSKGCQYNFRVKGSTSWTGWRQAPAGEVALLALILNEKPVFYNPDTGWIYTGAEPIGE